MSAELLVGIGIVIASVALLVLAVGFIVWAFTVGKGE